MIKNKIFYILKPLIPRKIQLYIRRKLILKKRELYKDIWPIDYKSSKHPQNWTGWPDNKKFAIVLTHDVESETGHQRCMQLMNIEKSLGFRSAFNFVPERYNVSMDLIRDLKNNGFEVGVHGLNHDGKLYASQAIFNERAMKINQYIKAWDAVGFRSPAMHHNFDWIHKLDIEYDCSSFDTDPFEPQPDGVATIFPFWINGNGTNKGYVELPYTLPQDHSLYILMKENNIAIWRKKTEWIASNGGMVLLNTHPDYINFTDKNNGLEEYAIDYYVQFLKYIKNEYSENYWNALPREIAEFWKSGMLRN